MRARSVGQCLVLLVSIGAGGCAAGEPLDHGPQALELADISLVTGIVYVDVTDPEGRPLPADAVWVATDYQEPAPAACYELDPTPACMTWLAEFEADAEVSVWAEVCGESYLGTLAVFDMAPGLEDDIRSAHVTVVADVEPCGTTTPIPGGPTTR